MLQYPKIDPVAIALGPIAIRWYGLMYLIGIGIGWMLLRRRARRPGSDWTKQDIDDLVFYCVLGIILGGRIGYALIYSLPTLLADPLYLIRIWEGGMSFHGGLLGVLLAMYLYGRRGRVRRSFFTVTDFLAPAIPPGLFCGRIGNFINGELWGKTTDVPWAFLVAGEARHPTQLYEAALEGIALFVILWAFSARPRPVSAVSGLFLLCYGVFRFAIEFIRVPDQQFQYLALGWVTMGQILSAPMIVFGVVLLASSYQRRSRAPETAVR